MATNQFEDFEQAFFNVAKLIIPERNERKHKITYEYLNKPKLVKRTVAPFKIQEKQPKQHAKVQLPVIKLKTLRQTQKTISSQKTEVTSHKKLTNLTKYNQQQNSRGEEDAQPEQKIRKTQLLNLGLKKKPKGKINQFMRNILMRTKIDDQITIQKSPFQSDFRSNEHRSPRVTSLDQKKNDMEQKQIHTGSHIPRKAYSHNKIKGLKNTINNQKPPHQRNTGVELPNVNQHRSIVQMVKNDEKRKQKLRLQKRKKEDTQTSTEENTSATERTNTQKAQLIIKNIENETIPEQIQYSTNQERQDAAISQAIQSCSQQN